MNPIFINLFILAVMGLPVALIVAPRAIYGWVTGLCVLVIGWLVWEGLRPMSWSEGDGGFTLAFACIWAVLLALCWLIRTGFDAWYFRGRDAPPKDQRPFWACVALCVTGWMGWLGGPTLARLIPAPFTLLVALVLAAGLIVAARRTLSDAGQWAAVASALALLIGSAAILTWPTRIAAAAQYQAAGRAYCLMVADGGDGYRTVTSLSDLTPLIMRATENPTLRNQHGLLILPDGPPRNFSYRRVGFIDVADMVSRNDERRCRPVPRFIDTLLLW